MWLLIILLLTSCSTKIEVIPNIACKEISVAVRGEVKEDKKIVLPCESTFNDLLSVIELTDSADVSMFHLDMPLFDGDIIEIPKYHSERVSINNGSKEELMTLKGIGEKTAEAIIDYRNKYGLFTNIDDLKNVKGIGKKV